MKTVLSKTDFPSKIYWRDGRVTDGSKCVVQNNHHVAWQTVNGDRTKPNALRYWRVVGNGLRGHCVRLDPRSGYSHQTGGFGSILDSDGDISSSTVRDSLYAAAKQAALDELSQAVRGDLDVSIDLLQLKQTKELCGDLLLATRSFVAKSQALRWQYLRGKRSALKDAGQLWLMFHLGIKPTVATLYGAFEKFNTASQDEKPLVHFRGKGSRRQTAGKNVGVTGFSWQSTDLKGQQDYSIRCQFDILLKADRNKLQKLGEWTSLNPVSWGYELLPLSFVLDYFYNLGGYLRNLETALVYGSLFHSGTETRTEKVDTFVLNGSGKWASPTDPGIDFQGFNGSHSYRLYDRSVLSFYPFPRLPVLEPRLGWQRIATVASLLAQLRTSASKRQRAQGSSSWTDRHRSYGWWELL